MHILALCSILGERLTAIDRELCLENVLMPERSLKGRLHLHIQVTINMVSAKKTYARL
jgi:hypothetical protein